MRGGEAGRQQENNLLGAEIYGFSSAPEHSLFSPRRAQPAESGIAGAPGRVSKQLGATTITGTATPA